VDVVKLTRDYLQRIREELGIHKVYPLAAQRMGATGAVSLSFVVLPDGTFTDVRVKRSSGNDLLDQAAIQTVATLSGRIRRPGQIGPHPLKTSVVLRYELG
jgi:protein TonB